MKKYILLTLLFLHVFVGYSQKSDINKTKPFSLEISANKNLNKPNSYFVKIDVINNAIYPKIIKYYCITTTKQLKNDLRIKIINNSDVFYYPELIRCVMANKKLIFKRKNVSIGYEIDFEKIRRDEDINAKKKMNDTYGLYSIQAIWYLPKDTIYSNIIELEYQKEK